MNGKSPAFVCLTGDEGEWHDLHPAFPNTRTACGESIPGTLPATSFRDDPPHMDEAYCGNCARLRGLRSSAQAPTAVGPTT